MCDSLSSDASENYQGFLEKWVQDSMNDRVTLICGGECELLFIACYIDVLNIVFMSERTLTSVFLQG